MSLNFKYYINRNVKSYQKYFPELTKPVLRVLLQICVHCIENNKYPEEIVEKAINKLNNSPNETPVHFIDLLSAILQIFHIYMRLPKGSIKEDELKESLKELKFTDECIEDIYKVLSNHGKALSLIYHDTSLLRPTIKRIHWRINLSMIESELTNVKHPTIILNILLTDGKIETIELSMQMFHSLRYNIAKLLKELQRVEDRQIMKI